MALVRSPVAESDRRFIIGRSAGCCNKCRISVFRENEFGEKARLGDDAHIWAYSEQGPRGRGSGAPIDPNDLSNIILLCKNCHAEVDQQPKQFTPAVLTSLREEHYAWVARCLGKSEVDKPRFQYTLYLNVPRLDMYAVTNSLLVPRMDVGSAQSFRDLGFGAGQVMANYTRILNDESIHAFRAETAADIAGLEVGQHCFVGPANFRTVAIGRSSDLQSAWAKNESVIYREFSEWTLICLIDPRWITTSTAGSTLKSGHARLCGVVRVNRIDVNTRVAYASPLFLAQ